MIELLPPLMMIGLAGAMVLAFLAIGLPKLLVAGHAAWTEALRVWGLMS